MNTTRRGKIARLPAAVREEVNRRLRDGVTAAAVVAWLNGLPEVQAVLAAGFSGAPVREQNVSEWRQGGYQEWLVAQAAGQWLERRRAAGAGPVADAGEILAQWVAAQYAMATRQMVVGPAGAGWRRLRQVCADVSRLRAGDHRAERLRLERERRPRGRQQAEQEDPDHFQRWLDTAACPPQGDPLSLLSPRRGRVGPANSRRMKAIERRAPARSGPGGFAPGAVCECSGATLPSNAPDTTAIAMMTVRFSQPAAQRRALRPLRRGIGAAVLTFACAATVVCAGNWPNWRGPGGNQSTAGTFPTQWKAGETAWTLALPGKGTSTPIVWNGRAFLTTPADGEDAVMAVDLATGKQLWLTKLGPLSPARHRTLASSCNASPVTDGESIFVTFRSGHFAALDLDGKVRWQQNLVEKFGEEKLFWDQGSSPVVVGRFVIVVRMHDGESWVAAFDKATGDLAWRVPRNFTVPNENNNAYTTPYVFDAGGKPAVLVLGADRVTAHDLADGRVLWSAGDFNPAGTGNWPAIASPLVVGDMAIVPEGRDDRGQGHVFGIRLGGTGDVTKTHRAWQRDDLGVFVPAPAAEAGRVYLLRHRGEVVCLDPATGKTIWTGTLPRTAAPYYASPIIAGGVLYAAREDGVVFTARVGERFELLGEHPMGERIVATPVAADGRILLRGDAHLFCIAAP